MNRLALLLLLLVATNSSFAAMTASDVASLVKLVDEKQRQTGDYKSICFVKESEKDKTPKLFEAVVYRHDESDKFMILFARPKEEAGKGYLKIDKNLWMYDPKTGKWERRTEREKIAGTNSRRADFDESRLSLEYDATFEKDENVENNQTHKIVLKAKKNVDVAYPQIILWIDLQDSNIIKREEYSLSEKLMRTTYYFKWSKTYSPSKKADVWVPKEMRIFDELEKGNSTIILIKSTDLEALPPNIFTKAWLESQGK